MAKHRDNGISVSTLLSDLQQELETMNGHERRKLRSFTPQEAQLLHDLILKQGQRDIFLAIADRILSESVDNNIFYSSPNIRLFSFLHELLGNARGNAAKAARNAGYSQNCAKQQGYRLIRRIQKAA